MSTNYTNNSIKAKTKETKETTETKKIVKVVRGSAKAKKKSEMSKIASNIISEEVKGIKEYAIYDVVIPVIKDTISQLVKGSIDMLFYGEVRSGGSSKGSRGGNGTRVSYSNYYDGKREDRREERRSSSRQSYDDILFDERADAEEVLNRMDEIVEQYGVVTVADLFDLAGITGNGYTDQNYGWTSTRSASIERTRHNEYFIKLHRPSPIK